RYATDLVYDAETFSESEINKRPKGKVVDISPKEFIKPMLASTAKKIFNDPKWIYELKYDGYRMISSVTDQQISLYSRNCISYKDKFSAIKTELTNMPHTAILDGEVVVVDQNGVPDFQK